MTEEQRSHVVIAGVTTRALAVSAARAGYRVTAVDAFGDLDLRAAVEVIALRPEQGNRYTPLGAAAAARAVGASLAAYTSNFENYPHAVAALAAGRQLLGNPPEVLTRVRDPILLMRSLRRRGFITPRTRATPFTGWTSGSWLLKPRRSGGGHGTRAWRPDRPVPRTHYLQELIPGAPGSVVFAADGRRALTLGLSRQLVGDARLGARGFRYCGNLLGPPAQLFPRQDQLIETAAALASTVTEEFGLVGVNGLDFIARRGIPYPIEVNPRFSASMELVERTQGISIFQAHARACRGALPDLPLPGPAVVGKAIVFARREVILGDTGSWLEDDWLADIPHPGERIRRSHPICTVFATGSDARACHRALIRRAAGVHRLALAHTRGAA